MVNLNEVLGQYLREQISIEEQLYQDIESHIREIDQVKFTDVLGILKNTSNFLAQHFTPLNKLLDTLDHEERRGKIQSAQSNGVHYDSDSEKIKNKPVSQILRDAYAALNRVTISNTLLYTTALALDRKEVALVALKHLENLTPLVVKIGELMPNVVARELHSYSPDIDLAIAKTALENVQLAWRKAS